LQNTVQSLVRRSIRHPWAVLIAFAIGCVVAVVGVLRLEHEDDVLVFLPEDDPDVALFRDVSERFGSLRVALVGVALPDDVEGDVLAGESLARIGAATTAFAADPAVARVTSLTTVTHLEFRGDGIVVDRLVNASPRTDAEHAALRARVLADEMVVGTLVSRDARAVALMVYLRPDTSTTEAVDRIRAIAEQSLGGFEVHLAGAPFYADAIYGAARRDVVRLSPIAAILLISVVLLSFRDFVGVVTTFATVGIAVLAVLGTMGMAGERTTVLTSTLPVLLLATGSAYAVHVLGRYYVERERLGPTEAIVAAVDVVARPVAIAAWTTSAAFLAFLAMDVQPVRAFGLQVALGTIVCWLTALTFVPAVLTLLPREPQREQLIPLGSALLRVWRFTMRHRVPILVGLLLVGVGSAIPMRHVRVKTEAQAFLGEGTPAWHAERFFEERFGGARFVQVLVEGDLTDPVALRRVAMVVERASALPGVTQVSAATDPIALTIELLGGVRRLPTTSGQAGSAYVFLDGTPDIGPMLQDDHGAALVQIRVRGDAVPVVDALEVWLPELAAIDPLAPETVARRLAWLAEAAGGSVDPAALASAIDAATRPMAMDAAAERAAALAFVRGDEVADLPASVRTRIEQAILAGDDPAAALRAIVAAADEPEFWVEQLGRAQVDDRGRRAVEHAFETLRVAMGVDVLAVRQRLLPIVHDLLDPTMTASQSPVAARVTGEPVLDRALSRSVSRNQIRTMGLGLAAVLVLLIVLFRSLPIALVCVAPAILTATVLGGAMGVLGVQIDLSTAMVGAILTDTASDFGMHYLWYLRRQPPEQVVSTVGPIMIVSNVLVALGFFAFALGSSPVMHVFGSLSAATCVVSSVIACLLVPAMWRWVSGPTGPQRRYHMTPSNSHSPIHSQCSSEMHWASSVTSGHSTTQPVSICQKQSSSSSHSAT